jgi:hypothetical protein
MTTKLKSVSGNTVAYLETGHVVRHSLCAFLFSLATPHSTRAVSPGRLTDDNPKGFVPRDQGELDRKHALVDVEIGATDTARLCI